MPESEAIRFLESAGARYHLFIHAGPVSSLEQAARERGQQPGQVIRTILFKRPDQGYFLVLVSGPRQVDWRLLRKIIRSNRVALATPDEVFNVTGYRIGTVSPFGLPNKLPVYCDLRMHDQTEISFGSGLPGVAIVMSLHDALPLLEPVTWIHI